MIFCLQVGQANLNSAITFGQYFYITLCVARRFVKKMRNGKGTTMTKITQMRVMLISRWQVLCHGRRLSGRLCYRRVRLVIGDETAAERGQREGDGNE